ncbi:hypothetical protein GJ496_010677 [Pomphorhynchus laevis]|nr:hypothetical protein GJ496_010677 [Pomphorhynchus laevis]
MSICKLHFQLRLRKSFVVQPYRESTASSNSLRSSLSLSAFSCKILSHEDASCNSEHSNSNARETRGSFIPTHFIIVEIPKSKITPLRLRDQQELIAIVR